MSDQPTKYLFYVYAPDYTDPDCLARRLSVREKHLANAKTIEAAGLLRTSTVQARAPPPPRLTLISIPHLRVLGKRGLNGSPCVQAAGARYSRLRRTSRRARRRWSALA